VSLLIASIIWFAGTISAFIAGALFGMAAEKSAQARREEARIQGILNRVWKGVENEAQAKGKVN